MVTPPPDQLCGSNAALSGDGNVWRRGAATTTSLATATASPAPTTAPATVVAYQQDGAAAGAAATLHDVSPREGNRTRPPPVPGHVPVPVGGALYVARVERGVAAAAVAAAATGAAARAAAAAASVAARCAAFDLPP